MIFREPIYNYVHWNKGFDLIDIRYLCASIGTLYDELSTSQEKWSQIIRAIMTPKIATKTKNQIISTYKKYGCEERHLESFYLVIANSFNRVNNYLSIGDIQSALDSLLTLLVEPLSRLGSWFNKPEGTFEYFFTVHILNPFLNKTCT